MCGPTPLTEGLRLLGAQVRSDLAKLAYPDRAWVKPLPGPSGELVFDVVIVGGGQCGLTTAFGLIREQVTNILVLDENPAGKEGPWVTYARMVTLRTNKALTGLDLGVPSLTFQGVLLCERPHDVVMHARRMNHLLVEWHMPHHVHAVRRAALCRVVSVQSYYEAKYGAAAWQSLDKIPKEEWMSYLVWYRQVLRLPVRNQTKVQRIEPQPTEGRGYLFKVTTTAPSGTCTIMTRKVVLATGIQGGGEWHVPAFIKDSAAPHLYAHTSQAIDFGALRGKRVAVLGGGASAFDNAQFGLEQGVGEVHVFVRREELPRINPIRYMEFSGFLRHFSDLDDATKYAGINFFLQFNQPPTNDTFNRASRFPNFHLHTGSPWEKLQQEGEQVRILTPKGDEGLFDFLIVSTGLLTDTKLRPELAAVSDQVATWADRYTPPCEEQRNKLIDAHPYLGTNFEFQEKVPGNAPCLRGIFAYNYSALASLGLSASALSGMKYAMPKLIHGITRQLFLDDQHLFVSEYLDYSTEEFVGTWPPKDRAGCAQQQQQEGGCGATASAQAGGADGACCAVPCLQDLHASLGVPAVASKLQALC